MVNKKHIFLSWPRCIYGSQGQQLTVEHLIPKYWLKTINAPPQIYNDYIHLFPAGRQINMMRGHGPITSLVPAAHRGVIARTLERMREKYPAVDPIMDEVLPYNMYVSWLQNPLCKHEKIRQQVLSDLGYY